MSYKIDLCKYSFWLEFIKFLHIERRKQLLEKIHLHIIKDSEEIEHSENSKYEFLLQENKYST